MLKIKVFSTTQMFAKKKCVTSMKICNCLRLQALLYDHLCFKAILVVYQLNRLMNIEKKYCNVALFTNVQMSKYS